MAQKPVLGKGLASLLPGKPPMAPPPVEGATPQTENKDRHPGISFASVDEIAVNVYQPRRDFEESTLDELAQSIRSNGIIQPLVVRKTDKGYELIAGERRLRAAKRAGLKAVPIVIRRSTDRESLELALIENIQRQNLNCVDESIAYQQLIDDFSLTQEEISIRVGKDRASVANYLRLLRLPENILEDLRRQRLSFGHGKALLSLEDPELRLRLYKEVCERKLSVRETEKRAQEIKEEAQKGPASGEKAGAADAKRAAVQQRLATISDDLTRHFSARVEVKGSDRKGKIVLHYSSREELERILSGMHN